LLLRTDRIAIMPRRLFARASAPKLVWVALKEAGKPRQIGIKTLRGIQLSPAATALMAKLQLLSSARDGSVRARPPGTKR
jgi:hypothetical protein